MANQVHTATVLPNQVRLASACADLARAEANLEEKERILTRARGLRQRGVIKVTPPWGAQARSGPEPDGGWQNWVAEDWEGRGSDHS